MGRDKVKQKKTRVTIGKEGEQAAEDYLSQHGYRILARNWRCEAGEIDIVAEWGETIVFVEVRSRKAYSRFGEPEESVDARKQRRIRRASEWFLRQYRLFDRKVRFDVIGIRWEGAKADIHHIPGAF